MPRAALERLQMTRLRKIVRYCHGKIPFYRKKFKEVGIKPQDIRSPEDLAKIPFTTKDDLRRAYPFRMLAVKLSQVLELHTSSGTTGHPTTCAYTKKDLEMWSRVMARIYAAAGTQKGDLIQNAYGYGLFTGGLGFHYGALKIGAVVLPIAAGGTERQIRLARELKTTVLACTPTYAAHLGEYAREKMGIDPARELSWRIGLFGAESWSESLRRRIERMLGLEAFDIYGLSEIIGPGVSVECGEHAGLHVYEDHFLPEIVSPETGEQLGEGEVGELVLTTLTREAMPLLRYRTGDMTTLRREACACGRTLGRMSRILGRTDDMLKVRGVKFWPTTIEHALLSVRGASQNYQLIIERPAELDVMILEVEPDRQLYESVGRDLSQLEGLALEIADSVKSRAGVGAQVRLVPVGQLPRFVGKAKRVIDRRK
jgi:phenylacetate-CoA ligase